MVEKFHGKKVLIVAYACEPNETSEPGVGWNFSKEISKFIEVSVLTRRNNRRVIEEESDHSLNFIYYDLPQFFLFLKKRVPLGLQIYFVLWQLGAYWKIYVGERKGRFQFDLYHHLTFGMTKMAPPGFLINKKFIWGPIGGGDVIPFKFLKRMGPKACLNEFTYRLVHKLSNISFNSFLSRKKSSAIIFRTQSSKAKFPLSGSGKRYVISESAFSTPTIWKKEMKSGFVHAVCLGRMIPGKGYEFALKGFHSFLNKGGKGSLTFLGEGPELVKLENYVRENELGNEVFFKGFLPNEEVHRILAGSNILLHPSFREGGSWAIMEAMSFGLPVICLNTSGPKDMVTTDCGFLIDLNSANQVVEDISEVLIKLQTDENLMSRLGNNAKQRIATDYNWRKRRDEIREVYKEVLINNNE